MKQITKYGIMLFALMLTTTMLIAQPKTGLTQQQMDEMKMARLETQNEVAPNAFYEIKELLGDADYDLQFEYPVGVGGGEAGIESDGNYIYTTKWNGAGFYKYELDGTYLEEFSVSGTSSVRDLAYDGTYFYGGAASTTVYEMDFDGQTLISSIGAPVDVRAIAYDDGEDGFWANNWSDDITLFDRSGGVLNSFGVGAYESFYGFAYDVQGPYLWGYCQGGSGNLLVQYELPDGTAISDFDMMTILTIPVSGDIAGGLFMHPDIVSGFWTIGGLVQNVCFWGIEMGITDVYANDVGVQSFVSPVSGPDLTTTEVVTVMVKNYGTDTQSNIPVSYTLDGGAAVSGTVAGPIAQGESAEYTFAGTVDLSTPGQTYVFEGCTELAGDENPDNDCKTANVTHTIPSYCIPSANCSYGDGFTDFIMADISNLGSGCSPNGYGDFTAMSTDLTAGNIYDATMTSGYDNQQVCLWIDFNDNKEFEEDERLLTDVALATGGQAYTFQVVIPSSVPDVTTRMRIRANWQSSAMDPCANFSYGETEDYTVVIGGNPLLADVGVLSIDMATTIQAGDVTPLATVKNFGTEAQSFPVTMTIDTYSSTVNVTDLQPGSTEQVSFGTWAATEGTYLVGACTELVGDENPANDCNELEVTVESGTTLDPPQNLQAEVIPPNDVLLTWEPPQEDGVWLFWDSGENLDGIGLTEGGDFMVAARWEPDQLTPWNGWYLTQVAIFPRSELGCDFTLMVWIGPDAGTVLVEQPLTGLIQNEWNIITLVTPVVVDASDELWVGYSITNQLPGDYPAGVDGGPAVAGFGDKIYFDNVWDNLSNFGLDYNWNIQAFLQENTDAGNLAQPIAFTYPTGSDNSQPISGNLKTADNPIFMENRAFLGYNVYRDEVIIANTIADTTYLDEDLPDGTYSYTVTAFYDEGESSAAGPEVVTIQTGGSIIFETFEDYNANDYLVQQANAMGRDYWTTWSGAPGTAEDPMVTDAVAFAGNNAVVIEGTNDAVLLLGDKTEGNYSVSFYIYIPTGKIGYFNLLQDFAGSSSLWGMQAYFDAGGAGLVDAGGAGAGTFSYDYDTWIFVNLDIDLNADFAEMFVDGVSIVTWQWSTGAFGQNTLNQLGAMNLYAWNVGGTPGAIFDDIDFKALDGLPPPTNLQATVDECTVDLTWTAPGGGPGELIELIQHDGNSLNAYYQSYNNGYGVVWDISAYPNCTIEYLDYYHASWGVTGIWDYNLHIVDWDTYTEVAVIGPLQTTGDDIWEVNIPLGSLAGQSGLVGIFLEPLSNDPADAYPCLSADNVGPDGLSFFGELPDYSLFGVSGVGDFLMDLWIMTEGKNIVKPQKFTGLTQGTGNTRTDVTNTFNGSVILNQTEIIRALQGYNVYRGDIGFLNFVVPTAYTDVVPANGTYAYAVTALYDEGESLPAGPIDVIVTNCGGGPIINVIPASVTQNVPLNGTAQANLAITNTGDADLTFSIDIQYIVETSSPPVNIDPEAYERLYARMRSDGLLGETSAEIAPGVVPGPINYTDDDYDLQFEFPVGVGGGEAGIETDGNYIYTTKWNGTGFYRYEMDGTYLEQFEVPGTTSVRDLAYDGTYFYGGAASTTVYEMDFDAQTLISSFGAPVDVRAVAYDDGEDGFWANNWSTDITLFDRSGGVLNSFGVGAYESFYGFAYDTQGPYLWGYSQGGSGNLLVKYELPSGNALSDFDMMTILTMPATGDIAGGLFMHPDIVSGFWTIGGTVQNVCIWGIEMGVTEVFPNDVGVSNIVEPSSGVDLTSTEPITIKIKNFGTETQSDIPYEVNWTGITSGSYSGVYAGPLATGETVDITLPVTADLSAYGDYEFEACTQLVGDENPDNDCKSKTVTNSEPTLCVDNLYSTGCTYGDGLIYWDLDDVNVPNIPCSGTPPWYHDYTDMVHTLPPGDYILTVQAGYNDTYFDVWIDYNDDLLLTNDELVIDDGVCASTGTNYEFTITIPAGAIGGEHILRFRTNWTSPVTDPCATYSYGNCCDFKANTGDSDGWLAANPLTGTVPAGQTQNVELNFDATGLEAGPYYANLEITNNSPTTPVDVPVTMIVGEIVNPTIVIVPMSLEETLAPDEIAVQQVTVTNIGQEPLNFDIEVVTGLVADPVQIDPEAYERLYARMEADGISPEHSLGMAPAGSSIPSSYSPKKLMDGMRGEIAYGDNVEADNFYSFDVDDPSAITVIGSASYAAFCGDFAPGDVDNMYVIDYNDDVLKMVDITTGEATTVVSVPCPMSGSGGIWTELAIDKNDGTFYATATDINVSNLYIIDPVTGDITLVGDMGIAAVISCTIDLSGVMYAFDIVSDNMYTVDLSTGVGTLLGAAGFNGNYAQGMGYDPVNDVIYLAAYSTFAELRVLNTATGATTSLGNLPGETGAFGFPYQGGAQPTNDVGVQVFVSPVTGPYLTTTEIVIIKVKNYGTASQSNIPVFYTLDGGAQVTGTVPGPVASGESVEYTFAGTVDLSIPGQSYVFEGCTNLAGDENPNNDCKTSTVTNVIPSYCDASTQIEDEWIANVLCGDIDNSSGWQGGVADYTDISTNIDAGASEPITITNGNAWTSDIVYVWVDWNNNFEFETGDEEFQLTNVGGTGQTFTGDITVPMGTIDGDHRMRIRMTYSTPPEPCGDATYGEVEDYTIVSGGGGPTTWLSAEPLSGTLTQNESIIIDVTFNSAGLIAGIYDGALIFTSNDPNNPTVNVPATLTVTDGEVPIIDVDPDSFEETVFIGTSETETMTICNIGGGSLDYSMTIDYPVDGSLIKYDPATNQNSNIDLSDVNEVSPNTNPNTQSSVTDDPWDLQFSVPVGVGGGEAGIETDGSYIYTTKWNGTGFYRYEMDGTYLDYFQVPGTTSVRDLAYDGTYFYGGAASTTVYEMDFDGQTLISSFGAPIAVRAIAYDNDEDGFYANNWSDDITLFDRSGGVLNSFPVGSWGSYYGFAYDNYQGEKFLYGFSQDGNGDEIVQMELPSGVETGFTYDVTQDLGAASIAGGLFIAENAFVSGTASIGGLMQNEVLFAYELHSVEGPVWWLSVDPVSGSVAGGDCDDITVTFDATQLSQGTYDATIHIASNDPATPVFDVPVTMNVIESGGPIISIDPMSLEETLEPNQSSIQEVVVSNIGTEPLNFDIEVVTNPAADPVQIDPLEYSQMLAQRMETEGIGFGDAEAASGIIPGAINYTDDDYDLQFEFPVGVGGGEAGLESDGDHIYTTKWNGTGFYRYAMDGTYLEQFEVPGTTSVRDLAYDGTYFYGGAASTTVYEMDFDAQTLISSFGAPVDVRAVAYDDGEDGFWANNWSTDITLFDRSGGVLNSFGVGAYESFYGFAYDVQGPYLWGYSQGGSGNLLVKYELPSGNALSDFDMMTILTIPVSGDIAGGLFMHPDIVSGTWTIGGTVQNVCIWGIEMGTTSVYTNDVGVQSFVSPVSGPDLTANEIVTIKVKNYGTDTQSNIPVSYTLDGGAAVTGTVAGPIAQGESTEYTFAGTVDLSTPGQTYVFEGCTELAGDENPDNDCKTANVTHTIPSYCIPSANCSYGDGFTDFIMVDISNLGSGCSPNGYGDFTYMSTDLTAGNTYDAIMTSGYDNQQVCLWIDFNDDKTFQDDERLLTDVALATAGQAYTFQVVIPSSVPDVTTRMRIRANWQNSAADPCANFTYGETEDYTIVIGGGTPTSWLSADPLSGSLEPGDDTTIYVTFNSAGLAVGDYTGALIFTSNDPNNPTVDVPATLHVIEDCPYPPATDLTATEIAPNDVLITWVAPEIPGGVIRWDDGINNDGIGLTDGGTFLVAARWEGAQLTQYDGFFLTHVDMFPRSDLGTVFTVKIWKDPNAATLVVSQALPNLTQNEWNTIELETPVQIDATTELWIGYECADQPAGDYPAGCDAGPAVAGFGDKIYLTGWDNLSNYGLDYNWNIAGIIGLAADGKPLAKPIAMNQTISNPDSDLAQGFLPKAENPEWELTTRELIGYNVYIDGSTDPLNSSLIQETEYIHNDVPNGDHFYVVGADYEICESMSEPVYITVTEIEELGNNRTSIYPNPATDIVNIESGMNISYIRIMNNIGQIVYKKSVDQKFIQINTASFENGIYIIKIDTANGIVIEKLIIQ